jgi:stearoyl-CoA desaturase (Delta-9 desaturase)
MTLELISSPSPTPHPVEEHNPPPGLVARVVTALIVGIPFLALVFGVIDVGGRGIHLPDVLLAVVFCILIGHGMTIGFHRLLAHKSFTARRAIKLIHVAFGSAYTGGPIGWVANHRRHHVFADTASDPHSPQRHGGGVQGPVKRLWPAHLGWLSAARRASCRRHGADQLADRDIVVMDRLFPVWCVVSLALPFGLGCLLGGTLGAAFRGLIWAGLVRICVLHRATWSVNSPCNKFGRRLFATKNRSTNVAALAISVGESGHNGHYTVPRSARHGLLRGQWDSSAMLIRLERMALLHDVHWPDAPVRNRTLTIGGQRRPQHRPNTWGR